MPQKLPLAEIIAARMDELGIRVEHLAVAARLHKTTVYRILKGESHPRPTTLRRLARALRLPLVDLTDQIEMDALTSHYPDDHPLEALLKGQIELVPARLADEAAAAALSAILDVHLSVDPEVRRGLYGEPATTSEVVAAYRAVPRLLQRTAVREAVRAVLDVQLRQGLEAEEHAQLHQYSGSRHLNPAPRSFHQARIYRGVREREWAEARVEDMRQARVRRRQDERAERDRKRRTD